MGLILNRDELCQALGVSDSAITAWEKKGMPTVRRGRGRGMRSLYDLDRVKTWCASTGYGHSIQALTARFLRGEPEAAPAPPPTVQTSERDDEAREAIAMRPALEAALLALPAALATARLDVALVDQVLGDVFGALRAELVGRGQSAEACELLQGMLDEERQRPGTWTR